VPPEPPEAVRSVLVPEQTVADDGVIVIAGDVVTVTVTVVVALHDALLHVTVYVVDVLGDAVTDEPVDALNDVFGAQV
jgi:hypothetical protein